MNIKRICGDNCKDKNGNCPVSGSDGLPVQCVGPWVEDKYYFLEGYLNASCEARRKFSDLGNATYIDLFSGPGKCIIKKELREIEGGGLRAFNREEARFNEYFYFDLIEENVKALKKRVKDNANCHVKTGDSNNLIATAIKQLREKEQAIKRYRYHFAFVDPFGAEGLRFDSLREMAKMRRMDLLINFPIGSIKRNIDVWLAKKETILDLFLGTDVWRERIKTRSSQSIFKILLDVFREQLNSIGYPDEGLMMVTSNANIYSSLPTVGVKNTKEVDLYVLILASKHKLGQKIWSSVIKTKPDGQKSLF